MTSSLDVPHRGPSLRKRLGLVLSLLLLVAGIGWLGHGPHRRVPALILEQAAAHGWNIASQSRNEGWFSTTLGNAQALAGGDAGLRVEMARLKIEHWPFHAPRVSVEGVTVHLQGDPVPSFQAVAKAWFSPQATLDVGPVDVIVEHRLLGTLRLGAVNIEHQGEAFFLSAGHARQGDLTWLDVRLRLEQRNKALVVDFAVGEKRKLQLTCFPSERGTARWLLDVPHGPLRPLLQPLGVILGDEFAATLGAGAISLDIPEDPAQQMHGRVQMVVDDWPLFAPAEAEPLLVRTVSLLSNLVASPDGSRWELPRAEVTMPVFSLAGPGSLQLGPQKRLVLDVEGERTCGQLRGLLPPGKALEDVRDFTKREGDVASSKQKARLEVRWDTGSRKDPFRPFWRFEPACGLTPWQANP
jgi:hypothetical protein